MYILSENEIIRHRQRLLAKAVGLQEMNLLGEARNRIMEIHSFTYDESWQGLNVESALVLAMLGRTKHIMQLKLGENLIGYPFELSSYMFFADGKLITDIADIYSEHQYLYVSFHKEISYINVEVVVFKHDYIRFDREISSGFNIPTHLYEDDPVFVEVYGDNDILTEDVDYTITDKVLTLIDDTHSEYSVLSAQDNRTFKIAYFESDNLIIPEEGHLFVDLFRVNFNGDTHDLASGTFNNSMNVSNPGKKFKALQLKIPFYGEQFHYRNMLRKDGFSFASLPTEYLSKLDIEPYSIRGEDAPTLLLDVIGADNTFGFSFYKQIFRENKQTNFYNLSAPRENDTEYIFTRYNYDDRPVDWFYNRKLVQKYNTVTKEGSVHGIHIPKTELPGFNPDTDCMVSILREPGRYRQDYSFTPVNTGYIIIDFDPRTVDDFEIFHEGIKYTWGFEDWDKDFTYIYRNSKHYMFFNRECQTYDYVSVMHGNYKKVEDISGDGIAAPNIVIDERMEIRLNGLLLIENKDYIIYSKDHIVYSQEVIDTGATPEIITKALPLDTPYQETVNDFVSELITANPTITDKPTADIALPALPAIRSMESKKKHVFFTTEMEGVTYNIASGKSDTWVETIFADQITARGNIVIDGTNKIYPRILRKGPFSSVGIYVSEAHLFAINDCVPSGAYAFWVNDQPVYQMVEAGKPIGDNLILWLDGRYGDNEGNVLAWEDETGNQNAVTLENFNLTENSGWTGYGLKFDSIDDYISGVYIPDDTFDISICVNFLTHTPPSDSLIDLSNPTYNILTRLSERDNIDEYDISLDGTLVSMQVYNKILTDEEVSNNFIHEKAVSDTINANYDYGENSYFVLTLSSRFTGNQLTMYKKSMDGSIDIKQTF